jgi:pimeloyl-ACP methyl ester carboxylesterase
MSTFVFVHGAWHGSWCWAPVVARLRDAGHEAIVLDLPGRAGDPTPHGEITLATYARKVCRVIELQREPVVLVGHSLGGLSISAAAEASPERIRTLVFVAAVLLRDGQSAQEVVGTDDNTLLASSVMTNETVTSSMLRPDAPCRELFYGECTEDDARRATAMLVPEPLAPPTTPLRTTSERFGRVPRVYVECLRDRALSLDLQRRMQAALPCARTIALDTDHSPFLSASGELSAALAGL